MEHKKVIGNLFFLTRKFLMRTPMRRGLWERKKHDKKISILTVLMSGSLWLLFVLDALPYVCMVRYGRPAVFVWLCKLHTIEDHVRAMPRL